MSPNGYFEKALASIPWHDEYVSAEKEQESATCGIVHLGYRWDIEHLPRDVNVRRKINEGQWEDWQYVVGRLLRFRDGPPVLPFARGRSTTKHDKVPAAEIAQNPRISKPSAIQELRRSITMPNRSRPANPPKNAQVEWIGTMAAITALGMMPLRYWV